MLSGLFHRLETGYGVFGFLSSIVRDTALGLSPVSPLSKACLRWASVMLRRFCSACVASVVTEDGPASGSILAALIKAK